jgi:putative redox protein
METVSGTVSMKWVGSNLMTGADSRGTPLVTGKWIDSEPAWTGLKSSDLLLLSAASCSAYDIVSILKKQRQALQGLEILCTGDQEARPPYRFTHIHLHYIIKGRLDPDKVARAIKLSEDKYCSVINTLRPSVDITSDFEIIDEGS